LERKQYGVDEWIVRATEQIKFTPDRLEVAAELREHLEDKLFDLRRIYPDMTEEAAVQRALNQMGDAREVGRELAKIHRPWLGYLWRLSQVVLGIIMLITTIVSINYGFGGGNGWFKFGVKIEPSEHEVNAVYHELDVHCEPVYVDGYRVTVEEVIWVERDGGYHDLAIVLHTMSPYFWARDGRNIYRTMEATDSMGNVYYSAKNVYNDMTPVNMDKEGYIHGTGSGYGPFHQDYILWVNNIDPTAEWLRLEYDWLGRSFSIPIGLKEGER